MSYEVKHNWTVMVHLAGDNNLSAECIYALTEMMRIGTDKDVAVVAQLDTSVHDNTRIVIDRDTMSGRLRLKLKKRKEEHARAGGGGGEAAKAEEAAAKAEKEAAGGECGGRAPLAERAERAERQAGAAKLLRDDL